MPFARNKSVSGMTLVEVTCALTIVAAAIAATFSLLSQLRITQRRTSAEVQAYGAARAALHDSRLAGEARPSSATAEPGGLVEVDAAVLIDAPNGLRTTTILARVKDLTGHSHNVVSLSALDLTPRAFAPELPSDPILVDTGPSIQHISISCDPSAGTVTGEGEYAHGTVVDITATPLAGHTFVRWDGSPVSPNAATTQVLANQDKALTAVFSP